MVGLHAKNPSKPQADFGVPSRENTVEKSLGKNTVEKRLAIDKDC